MRNYITVTLMIIGSIQLLNAQNLVPNPSFEEHDSCPAPLQLDRISLAVGWSTYRIIPEYFHTCSSISAGSVPGNDFGYQQPATGNAYAGITTFWSFLFRESLGAQLLSPLIKDSVYYISFKASPGYGGDQQVGSFANKLGVKFSTVPYDKDNPVPIDNFAHVYTDEIISDTVGWTVISGSFVADSTYNYIMIGNFFDDSNTDTIRNQLLGPRAYYYIDDVCVSLNSKTCNTSTGFLEKTTPDLVVYPNPTTDKLFIKLDIYVTDNIEILNSSGQKIHTKIEYKNGTVTIYLGGAQPGLYFAMIQHQKNFYSYKFLIVKP